MSGINAPKRAGRMPMRVQMARTIVDLLDEDPRLFVVLADISADAFESASHRHPDRVVNVGIMEQTMISLAAGTALEGFIPVCHTLVPFLVERPFEQIKDDFCYQGLGGNLVSSGASYDYANMGMTHHGPRDVALLRTLPGMEIVVPGTAAEFDRLFRQAYADGSPTYFRTSLAQNAEDRDVRFGRLEVIRTGEQATVVAVGPTLDATLEAVEHLDVTVLYATTLVPFDARTLREMTPSRTLVLVEPFYEGTLVADVVRAMAPLAVRVEAIGVPRRVLSGYGTPEQHDEAIGLTPAGIRRRITGFLEADPRT